MPSPPLRRLRPDFRQRIYCWLGLASSDSRRYTFVPDPGWFPGLMLSCGVMHAEAAALLYSTNLFVLYYFDPRSDPDHPTSRLRPLRTLYNLLTTSPLSPSDLKIVLYQAACHQLTIYGDTNTCCLHGRPEYSDNPGPAQVILGEWHSAAVRSFSQIAPGRLRLSLVCNLDPQNSRTECHIRLAKTADRQLQQLAEDVGLHACGIHTPSLKPPASRATTTLATLPPELRIRFLEYTDLPPSNGYCCRRHHAAFSLACNCWTPPGPTLFLLCRTLYEDAQVPCPPWTLPLLEQCDEDHDDELLPTYGYPNERFAASESLSDVVPAPCLSYLRFFELVFPPYRPRSWLETQHPAMQDWRATVDWLRDRINLSELTLRFMVADLPGSGRPEAYLRSIAVEEGGTAMTAYMDLLQPLTTGQLQP
ncbi:hypothetical protein N657DRAFT_657140 [Parathielavia appendiculata]|uniref:Uncharacterized protein n=1 Tax=Parathielavia appendiculata TaxID=2587402 RepID=A0AAN6Z340_9PEZI|nr:hypothetical protein N657DRAFT_657140 [Parathielavia appendiculata]